MALDVCSATMKKRIATKAAFSPNHAASKIVIVGKMFLSKENQHAESQNKVCCRDARKHIPYPLQQMRRRLLCRRRHDMAGLSEAGRPIASILLSGMLACVAASSTLLAQAGSTGGSVAKTNKSISGSAEAGQPLQKSHPAPSPAARSKVFENPTIGGIRVDGCMKWGPVDCGAPAADHWCRSKGFARAAQWSVEKVHPTIFQDPQSSVKVCDYFFCGAFSRIACQ